MEYDCVEVCDGAEQVPVRGEEAAGLRTARLKEPSSAELPSVLEASEQVAPGENILCVGISVQFAGDPSFSKTQTRLQGRFNGGYAIDF